MTSVNFGLHLPSATVRRLLFLALATMVVACAVPDATSSTTTPGTFDLTDTSLLTRLGSAPFADVVWQRTVHDITVVGSRPHPDPVELALLDAALSELPRVLWEVGAPRSIIRIASAPEEEQVGNAVTFTRGPDIYLVDRTFDPDGDGTTRLDLARALAHEFAHVAQFRALDPAYIQAALDGDIARVDPADGSELVLSFAAQTGWTNESADPLHADWRLEGQAATEYGRTGPAEDMAESVAMLVLGRADWIPPDRGTWVAKWLGTSIKQLAAGKPWIPAGATEVSTAEDLYDEAAAARSAPGATHAEAHYFELPASVPEHLILGPDIERRLLQRGFGGAFARIDDEQLPHYQGSFSRSDGVRFWVELWDFRETTGFSSAPNVPILVYVELW
ncbi:hypothetical protein BMS3Abin02_01661 [bacterium BMS3Abin02]|nr:hypothetical protein BMS3Abin02_01661 [bacterium BMS3Abin02]